MVAKWRRVLLLGSLMMSCFAAGAWASNGIEKVEAFLRPDYQVLVDGKKVELDKPILLYNDSSYLPLRRISELLNADVKWQGETKTIYINTRFPGQPEAPKESNGSYPEIRVQNPFPYEVDYLGGHYVLLSDMVNQTIYYRVDDLALMGVDTRGLSKYKDVFTGSLYVPQAEIKAVWKQEPNFTIPIGPVVAGTVDSSLKTTLLDLAKSGIPILGQIGSEIVPKNATVSFADAVNGHPGWFCLYGRNEKMERIYFMVEMVQDDKGHWRQKSLQTISQDFFPKFFETKS
jgi:hypothetical protein